MDSLRAAFAPFGELVDVKIPQENGRSKGFGFVVYRNESSAAQAVREMNGYNLDGHNVIVTFSEKREPRTGGNDYGRGGGGSQYDDRRSSSSRRSRSPPSSRRAGRSPPRSSGFPPPSLQPPASTVASSSFARGPPPPVVVGGGTAWQSEAQFAPQSSSNLAPPLAPPPSHFSSGTSSSYGGGRYGGRPPQQQQQPDDTALECKVYISGLPAHTTEEMIAEHFSMSGAIARKRQKNKFKDQWPYNIKLYYDDNQVFKGDALLAYEDPNAAKTAPGFFDGSDFHGVKISVQQARRS